MNVWNHLYYKLFLWTTTYIFQTLSSLLKQKKIHLVKGVPKNCIRDWIYILAYIFRSYLWVYNNERPLPIEKLFDLDESVLYLLACNNVCVYLYFIVLSTHNMDFVVRLDAILCTGNISSCLRIWMDKPLWFVSRTK